jgi:hypothetical protein
MVLIIEFWLGKGSGGETIEASRTIDSNGDGLGEVEAVGTLEGRNLASRVDLQELSAGVESSGRVGLSLDQLQIEVIVLSSDQDGEGATVVLNSVRHETMKRKKRHLQADRRAFRKPF